jgi:S1-C subfamily serine protease
MVWLFDLFLLLTLIAYAFYGYRNGLLHSIAAFIGLVVGAILAFFLIPIVGEWISAPGWRVFAVVFVALTLIAGGQAAGLAIGTIIRRQVNKARNLRIVDRILGAIVSLIATALVVSLISSSIPSLGVPFLTSTIANSTVIRTISAITPAPVETLLAQVRSVIVSDGLPTIAEALGGITTEPDLPHFETNNPALALAAQSVVRVTGTAYECGQTVSGSGFVVSSNRIVTNAHVVAGITDPVVDTPAGEALAGKVVYFDPKNDIAVIAVNGMRTPPLKLSSTLDRGSDGVIDGYPFGGPLQSNAAKVLSVETENVKDIYGQKSTPREVYTLAAVVREGNSGGPVLSISGAVTGLVFAKSGTINNVGYALTMTEVAPVAAEASSLTSAVPSGACIRG